MPRIFAALLALFACNPAPEPGPTPAPVPLHVIGVTVVEADERNISKVQGGSNFHTYLTLQADEGTDPASLAYAPRGVFKVNIPSVRLQGMIEPAPAVGDHLEVQGTLSKMTPEYIDLVRVKRTPAPEVAPLPPG